MSTIDALSGPPLSLAVTAKAAKPDAPVLPPELNNFVQVWIVEARTAAQTSDALINLKLGGAGETVDPPEQ